MYDDDRDSLAAEYVLGTLAADERDHADALISLDPGFEAAVRRWERRLGELNVMVEAVEPRLAVWEKIKSGIGALAPVEALTSPPLIDDPATEILEEAPKLPGSQPPPLPGTPEAPEVPQVPPSPVASLASSLLSPQALHDDESPARRADRPNERPNWAADAGRSRVERGADVIYLARRARRWRRTSLLVGTIAALLALYVALWQFAPDLIPPQLQPRTAGTLMQALAPARAQQDRLVAVLQQDPNAPAFLLTFDTRGRTLFVRRVAAKPDATRSYELWLISSRLPAPRSLGLVGSEEFTERAVPASYDAETLRTANYAVSLEPAGGSPSGVPTGPVLFTGKAVEFAPVIPAAAASADLNPDPSRGSNASETDPHLPGSARPVRGQPR